MKIREVIHRRSERLKSSILSLGAALLCLAPQLRAESILQPNDVIAVCVAVDVKPGMVPLDIGSYLLMCHPVAGIRVIQSCFRTDSVGGFQKRAEIDIAPWKPSVVLTSHGAGEGVHAPESRGVSWHYPTNLGMTVDIVRKMGARIHVIGSPHCVDSVGFRNNPVDAKNCNENLAAVRDKGREVAQNKNVLFADIYGAMMDVMPKAKAAFGEKYIFAGTEGSPPGANGQLVMAYAFLKALGCDGAIGTITVDLASGKADGTPGQKIISCKDGTVEIESSRYPFCFTNMPEKSESATGIIEFFPFNDDLNRFLLVVKGLSGTKTKITWGKESREFQNSDLEKGVNLAAAFAAHTPFDTQFQKVESALWKQQQLQDVYTVFFGNLQAFKELIPDSIDALNQISSGIIKQDKENAKAMAALVIPIRHTVKIEAIP